MKNLTMALIMFLGPVLAAQAQLDSIAHPHKKVVCQIMEFNKAGKFNYTFESDTYYPAHEGPGEFETEVALKTLGGTLFMSFSDTGVYEITYNPRKGEYGEFFRSEGEGFPSKIKLNASLQAYEEEDEIGNASLSISCSVQLKKK